MNAHVTTSHGSEAVFGRALERWQASPPDSEIQFTLRHLVLMEITGVITRWHAVLGIDRARPCQSSIEVVIDASSVETGVAGRDGDLRSEDFLDVETFPEIRFSSTEVRPDGANGFVIVGLLTIRDVTREIVLVGEHQERRATPGGTLAFTARAMIDRQELRLHWNQDLARGGVVVGDKVDLEVRLLARPCAEARPEGASDAPAASRAR